MIIWGVEMAMGMDGVVVLCTVSLSSATTSRPALLKCYYVMYEIIIHDPNSSRNTLFVDTTASITNIIMAIINVNV